MALVFVNNHFLFSELDEEQLAEPDWYIQKCRPRPGRDFIVTARGLLTQEIRADLEALRGFRFAGHPDIEISPRRLELLSEIVDRQIEAILV